ncbi:hypothetical protein XELAEV_18019017mg [Xenopus laevis]|uniref:Uncharacterized protein n=1 Tax=Xenopus laevis TaxID=8355 RepID=A0A974DFX6_XENLA|nr:hypothetical protein XELAEV_18019017mg [Xenopus laevis]
MSMKSPVEGSKKGSEQRDTDTIQRKKPLGQGNPALQSLLSNIQRDTDTIQREREPLGEAILPCRGYTLIYRGTQIKYRERELLGDGETQIQFRERDLLGDGNSVLKCLHSNKQRDPDTIQRKGTIGRKKYSRGELTL